MTRGISGAIRALADTDVDAIPPRDAAPRLGRLQLLAVVAALASASYLLARYVGLGPAVGPWAFWPINGILCGVFFRRHIREWPLIAAVAVVAQVLTIYVVRGDLARGATVIGALAGVAQATLAAWSMHRIGARDGPLQRPRDLGWFVGVVVIAIPLVITPLSALAFADGLGQTFPSAWRPLFVGNSLSMLLFAPPSMLGWPLAADKRRRWRGSPSEVATSQIAIVLLVLLVFGGPDHWFRFVALPYAMFPLLVWTALRCGPRWTALAILNVALVSAWFTARGNGPFAISGALDEQVLALQTYLAFLALTALLLSALAEQLRRSLEDTALQTSIRQALLESSGAIVELRDLEGRFVLVNGRMEELHGHTRDEMIGQSAARVMGDNARAMMIAHDRRVMERGVPLTFDESIVIDGATRHFVTTRFPVRTFDGTVRYLGAIAREETVERELRDRLQRVQRVELVGQLAAGLAHDLNNLLTIVIGNVDEVQHNGDLPPDTRERLQETREAGARAAGLTGRLMSLGRARVPLPVLVTVDDALRELAPMLHLISRGSIDLRMQLNSGGVRVLADPMAIEQVVLNLVSNSRDAIHDEGEIVITTTTIEREGEAGKWVRLEVADTGAGMDEATLNRLFEPFFTTKSELKGTGLGLYTTALLVRQANGVIRATSTHGQGTRFVVELPVSS